MTTIDWNQALQTVDGDRELLSDIVNTTIEECEELLDVMEGDLAKGDGASLGRNAHTFKGNLRIFGSPYPTSLAEELENSGSSGELENCGQRIAKLREDSQALFNELRDYLDNRSD